MPDRQLVRLFLQRLLDHELVSPHADRREVLSLAAGGLVAVSLFLAVVLAIKYQFNQYMPPGLTTVFSLDDRVLFVSLSMIVMALVAVAEWDALALDPRDTAVLGVLPIPRAVIVRTKFVAALLFGGGFAVALNLGPTVLRAAALPERLPISATGVLWLMLGHGVATLMAGAFGFLAVLSLRETLQLVLGPRRFAWVSAWVQALLVVGLIVALLLLPGAYGGASRWLVDGRVSPRANPVAWFVGLHEAMAGSVIDGLPRGSPPRNQAAAERVATTEYHRLWPLFRVLSRAAASALTIVALLAVAACALNGRRWPLPPLTRSAQRGTIGRLGRSIAVRLIAPQPGTQAGFFFALQTLFRQPSHRTTLAASAAVGLAVTVVMVSAAGSEPQRDLATTSVWVLAVQTVLLSAVLAGFRQAVRLPAYLPAATTFQLAWAGDCGPYVTGVKRAGWAALVLPTLGGLAVWHCAILGPALAAWHGAVGVAVAAILMEGLFVAYRGLPFASAYVPSDSLKAGTLFLPFIVTGIALVLAWLERAATATPTSAAAFVGALIVASLTLHMLRTRLRPNEGLDLDGAPAEETSRLALSD